MLGDRDVAATLAVRDAQAARAFYEGVLGLTVLDFDAESGVGSYQSGAGVLVVYQAETGGRNPATSATWGVGEDFEAVVAALLARGVRLERYDGLDQDADGVARFGGRPAACAHHQRRRPQDPTAHLALPDPSATGATVPRCFGFVKSG